MTARQVWEAALVELSKVNAPSMLLLEFNYYINKAVNQYINKRYNIYDINLQTTDDLRVLKSTAILDVKKVTQYRDIQDFGTGIAKLFGATYEVTFPTDYLHILNCICIYKIQNANYKCFNIGDYVLFSAKRLTADSWSTIMNDYYNRPLPERPYYYIHNINTQDLIPTNPYDNGKGTDLDSEYTYKTPEYSYEYFIGNTQVYLKDGIVYSNETCTNRVNPLPEVDSLTIKIVKTSDAGSLSNFPRAISLKSRESSGKTTVDTVEKEIGVRYGNASTIRCEIRYGKDDSIFELQKVLIDYIKVPLFIRLTLELVDITLDTSQIMEFPDYVCQEIINELVLLVMERTADPRTQSNQAVSLSIANPAQQLEPQPQPQQRG